jgi:hypothetical protein
MVLLVTINAFPVLGIGAVDWQQKVYIEDGAHRSALATCYKAYRREFSLPDVMFPWEQAAETISPSSTLPTIESTKPSPRRSPRAKS